MQVLLRPLHDGDYPSVVAISDAIFPEFQWSVVDARRDELAWDHATYRRLRLVATIEDENGGTPVVGWGQIAHIPHQFSADTYDLRLEVDPSYRRRGVGRALFDRFLGELNGWNARRVRSRTKQTLTDGVAFLERRGFMQIDLDWASRLDISAFDFRRFEAAMQRPADGSIDITTLAAEQAHDPEALQKAYALHLTCTRDMPRPDPVTDVPFAQFLAQQVERSTALPEAYFLATHGGRYVGQSTLFRSSTDSAVFAQGMTGVLPDYRGRGIALALKLCTVRYAFDHGGQEIRTANSARNHPMLSVNEALGFERQGAWVTYQKDLAPQ
jgi:GNAT superfamily N-acetyltransferase